MSATSEVTVPGPETQDSMEDAVQPALPNTALDSQPAPRPERLGPPLQPAGNERGR